MTDDAPSTSHPRQSRLSGSLSALSGSLATACRALAAAAAARSWSSV